jgi:peptidoglycan/xylan/chitin deacetylase (PgdA/CDA1 family)
LSEIEVPSHWINMSWEDLAFLVDSGHTIGAHTAHHARLSEIPAKELAVEIVQSADLLEKKLGICVEHFAYTFGDLASFSPVALALARVRFPFIYTGLRGNNDVGVAPWAIRRDAIDPTNSNALVGAYLEGGADFLYAKSLRTYESWRVI